MSLTVLISLAILGLSYGCSMPTLTPRDIVCTDEYPWIFKGWVKHAFNLTDAGPAAEFDIQGKDSIIYDYIIQVDQVYKNTTEMPYIGGNQVVIRQDAAMYANHPMCLTHFYEGNSYVFFAKESEVHKHTSVTYLDVGGYTSPTQDAEFFLYNAESIPFYEALVANKLADGTPSWKHACEGGLSNDYDALTPEEKDLFEDLLHFKPFGNRQDAHL